MWVEATQCYKFILIFNMIDCQNMFIAMYAVCGTRSVIDARESSAGDNLEFEIGM